MSPRKKIPTKTELLQLQKLYKTDEKIGERLGGVPAYLVAYWRRKKGIPKYSLPKFSENEIRNLWERYGDDEKSGLELGISKAAFYNWRRRYGIREKPAFLKLEQLELNFPGSKYNPHANSLYGKQSVVQKILARSAGLEKAEIGQTVEIEPDVVLLHKSAGDIIGKFRKSGPEYVWNPNKILVTLDYSGASQDRCVADIHRDVREFVKRQGIKNFYDLREGTCHQVIVERGHAVPGQILLCTDNLCTSYGCMGSFAAGIDAEQMFHVWETGKLSLEIPGTIRINVTGRKPHGVYAKDVILSILKQLGTEAAQGRVIEYAGSVVSQMSISERFTLSNMSVELGAKAAICPYDATTRRYLNGRTMAHYKPVIPDKDAEYEGIYQVAVDHLSPQVGCPDNDQPVKSAAELEGLAVHEVILGTCSNGRFDDLRIAADILKGKSISPDCRLYVYPGSRSVYLEALKKGLIRVFVEAGAMVMNPGSVPFTSLQDGRLAEGERCLATTSRQVLADSSTDDTELYLCSPATAAASALNGSITDPSRYLK